MVNLNAAEPHFIRCLKPNGIKAASIWNPDLVTTQLRYTGMLETTRIRREGFAIRPTFADFVHRFGPLCIAYGLPANANESTCRAIMERTRLTDWQIGKSKVFLRYYHTDMLTEKQQPVQAAATDLQKCLRGFFARKVLAGAKIAKEGLSRQVDAFCSAVERNISVTRDVFLACCEEDDKRPKDFWEPKATSNDPGTAAGLYEGEKDVQTGSKAKGGGRVGRRQSIKWVEEQKEQGECDGNGLGGFAEWFAGVMSRGDAEAMLKKQPMGTFLIRVSETRFGYSLSATGDGRIKHFMVDQVKDTGKYVVVGNTHKFDSLDDLIGHHKKYALTDDGFKLVKPCPQSAANLDDFTR